MSNVVEFNNLRHSFRDEPHHNDGDIIVMDEKMNTEELSRVAEAGARAGEAFRSMFSTNNKE